MLTTSSVWSSSVTAFTPYTVRPMGRTSFSWKRTARPFFLARIKSCVPSLRIVSISASPSSSRMARIPVGRKHGLLDEPLLGRAHQIVLVVEFLDRHHRLHPLVPRQALEVIDQ